MKNRIRLFDTQADPWTMEQTVTEIGRRIDKGIFTQHVVVNVAKIVSMRKDPELRESVEGCDIINIDGMGVVWGARLLGLGVPERVAGIDLFYNLLKLAEKKGYPVFFLGARPDVVKRAVSNVLRMHPDIKVAGFHHGYFWDNEQEVVEEIRNSGARMLFVAITSPKKERFINRWKARLGVSLAMGVGGTFDILAGEAKRAPIWMQKAGLEWLYRLLQEPGRMWKRYLGTNAAFGWMLIKGLLTRKGH